MLGNVTSPEALDTDLVTGNTFEFLGVNPLLGRGIQPSDAQTGATPVVVLSYKVWVKRFGQDPSIVGNTSALSTTSCSIHFLISVLARMPSSPASAAANPFYAPRATIPMRHTIRVFTFMTHRTVSRH